MLLIDGSGSSYSSTFRETGHVCHVCFHSYAQVMKVQLPGWKESIQERRYQGRGVVFATRTKPSVENLQPGAYYLYHTCSKYYCLTLTGWVEILLTHITGIITSEDFVFVTTRAPIPSRHSAWNQYLLDALHPDKLWDWWCRNSPLTHRFRAYDERGPFFGNQRFCPLRK